MSEYIYDRSALLAHAKDQATKLNALNPLMADLSRRFGLEIDADGHYETWKIEGGIAGLGTKERYQTLTDEELKRRAAEGQAIIAHGRLKRAQEAGDTSVVKRDRLQGGGRASGDTW